MRWTVSTPAVALALAEIVADELHHQRTGRVAVSAADVHAREYPRSLRAQALERALGDLAAGKCSVFVPFEHDQFVRAVVKDTRIVCAALAANERRLDGVAELRSGALQRRAEGLAQLSGELRGDGPVIRRQAA